MPPRKYAIAGEPDFHNISDEKVKLFLDFAQQMIFAYKQHDREKTEVIRSIWKDLSLEDSRRDREAYEEEISAPKVPAPVIRKAPKLRMSPVKRKI